MKHRIGEYIRNRSYRRRIAEKPEDPTQALKDELLEAYRVYKGMFYPYKHNDGSLLAEQQFKIDELEAKLKEKQK